MAKKIHTYCISAKTGYVESESTTNTWFQFNSELPYDKAVEELINILRGIVKDRLKADEIQPKDCCKRAMSESPASKFCAICGTKLSKFEPEEYDEDTLLEMYRQLFIPTDRDSVEYDIYETLENHNIVFGFTRIDPNKKHILVFIQGIDHMVAGDEQRSDIGEVYEITPELIKDYEST